MSKSKPRQLSSHELEWVKLAATEGVPISWIAETVGRHYSTIQKLMKDWGIPPEADWVPIQIECRKFPLDRFHSEFSPVT